MAHRRISKTRIAVALAAVAAIGFGFYTTRKTAEARFLPNGGGCEAIRIGHERLVSMIRGLKTEIAADLPPEQIVALVWVEIELINSAVDQLDEFADACGGVEAGIRASFEDERRIAINARLAAIAKARSTAALK